MLVESLSFLTQLDGLNFVSRFWFPLVLEIPRFAIGLLAVAGCYLFAARRSSSSAANELTISVLLIGHNEGAALRRSITSILEQSKKCLQIVVVDDGSTDDMAQVGQKLKAERLIDVFVSTGLRGGKSSATNLGLTLCTGDVVIIADVDTSFDRYAIENILEPFCDPAVGCVSGNIGVRNYRASIIAKFQAIEYLITLSLGRQLLDLLGILMITSGAFTAFRRDALIAVGGWDVGPGEDANVTLKFRRAGWKIRFAPDAWALTDVPETVAGLLRQRRRWDASLVRVRLARFGGMLNPFRRNFYPLDAIGTFDVIYFHAILPLVFLFYLISAAVCWGAFFWTIIFVVSAFYITATTMVFFCACATAGHYGRLSLLPYVIGYTLFKAYIMRLVSLWAYVDELLIHRSYRDTFVPAKVQNRKP